MQSQQPPQPPYPAPPQPYEQPQVARTVPITDPFQHDKFLINQKVMSLGSKYYVYNEANQPLFFIERPVLKIKMLFGIFTDETRTQKLLSLDQDSAWTIINYAFTLRDANEQPIAYFKRQGYLSMLRRTWKIFDVQGQEIAQAHEDSWWKAILRRLTDLGPLFRTNFVVTRPDGTLIGEFIRRFTITDKYVLDMTKDPQRTLDRRIAVGLAVLLDNAEHR